MVMAILKASLNSEFVYNEVTIDKQIKGSQQCGPFLRQVPNRHSTYGRVKVKTIQLFQG